MIREEEFYGSIKFLMHRVLDLQFQVAGIKIVLNRHHENFSRQVDQVAAEFEVAPEVREFRGYIETLEIEQALATFANYKGPIQ
jgi:hypothetical protein